MTRIDQLRLPDSRMLDVRVSGPADGIPLVFHHGTPGSSYQLGGFARAAHERGFRVVTASRAGYGHSTRKPGRRVVDAVADTDAVLDFIGADRCVVAGWSGGGPHALACAARLERAQATVVIAGVAPFGADGLDWLAGMGQDNLDEFAATLRGETELRAYLEPAAAELKEADGAGIIEAMRSLLPAIDQEMITTEFGADLAAMNGDGLAEGCDGWLDDDLAFASDWGFDLAEITRPVAIWQGSADLMVPFAHGKWLASHVPGCSAHLEDGGGHLSILIGSADRMLDELAANAAG